MRISISDLTPKELVDSSFLVKLKSVQVARNGNPYLNVILMDNSGEIEGRVWDNAEEIAASFEKGEVVRVYGRVNLYQGKKQLIISSIIPVPQEEVDPKEFLPASKRDPDDMFRELQNHISSMKNEWLKKLATNIFSNTEIARKFRAAPAAVGVHHVYVGGLLEHVLSLCSLVKAIVPIYRILDEDLLISACIYHDIGKTEELSYAANFEYTDEGKLIGHLVQGVLLIDKEIAKISGFPKELRNALEHIILSHHGEYEFGSPKRPKFLEAIVFHFLDNLDSKVQGVLSFLEKNKPEGSWSGYHKIYDRYFYVGPLGTEKSIPTGSDMKQNGKQQSNNIYRTEQADLF